jgi:chromatin remodeling complex protein RSC6
MSTSTTGGKPKRKKRAKSKTGTKRKLPAALAKKLKPDATLSAVAGSGSASRAEFTKKIWAYIKRKSLQDPKDGRKILAKKDAALKKLLGKDVAGIGDVAKAISKHTSG